MNMTMGRDFALGWGKSFRYRIQKFSEAIFPNDQFLEEKIRFPPKIHNDLFPFLS